MIKEILPLTETRIEILTELFTGSLMAKEIADKVNKTLQTTYNTLSDMNEILNVEQNIYSIKPEVEVLIKNLLIKNLLEKRLKTYYDILPYIKKFAKPEKMILFGSYYRKEQNEKSDIDVYIITNENDKLISEIESKLTKLMKVKIQIVNVSPKIHLTKQDKFSELYLSISNSRKLGVEIPLEII